MKTKTKTKQKILKVFAMCILFLGSSQLLLAQQNTDPTQDVCEGSSAELYSLQGTSSTSTFLWEITSGGTIQTGQGSASITIDWDLVSAVGAGPHTLSVTETDGVGCIGLAETVEITLIEAPTADAGSPADACVGEVYTLSGTATNQTAILWTHNGAGTLTGETSETPIYTPDVTDALVTLTMTVSGLSPCTDATSTVVLTINQAPTANAGSDASICEGLTHTISGATASAYSTLTWTSNGTGTITGVNTLTPTYTPSSGETGNITLTLTLIGIAPCNDVTNIMILTIDPSPSPGPIWHN